MSIGAAIGVTPYFARGYVIGELSISVVYGPPHMPREPLVGVDRAHIGDDLYKGVHVLPIRADMPMDILDTIYHASHAEEVPHTLPVITTTLDPHHRNVRAVLIEIAHVDLLLRHDTTMESETPAGLDPGPDLSARLVFASVELNVLSAVLEYVPGRGLG